MYVAVGLESREALLTMACDSRAAWSMVLLAFLNDQGHEKTLKKPWEKPSKEHFRAL